MRAFSRILTVAFLLTSSPALAWWDFAKWGMTVDQLAKASGGRLESCGNGCPPTLIGFKPTHRLATDVVGFPGQAMFAFDASGRLNWTVLRVQSEAAFNPIERALMGVYGAPVDRSRSSVREVIWRDAAKKSTVRLLDIGVSYIEYKPVAGGL